MSMQKVDPLRTLTIWANSRCKLQNLIDKDHLEIYIYTYNVPFLMVNTKLIPPIDGDLGDGYRKSDRWDPPKFAQVWWQHVH